MSKLHVLGAQTTTGLIIIIKLGPDGKLYATGGSVRFDTSIPKDPQSAKVKLNN